MPSSPIAVLWETEALTFEGFTLNYYYCYVQDLEWIISGTITDGLTHSEYFRLRDLSTTWDPAHSWETAPGVWHQVLMPSYMRPDSNYYPIQGKRGLIPIASGPGACAARNEYIGNVGPWFIDPASATAAQRWFVCSQSPAAYWVANNRNEPSLRAIGYDLSPTQSREIVITDDEAHLQPLGPLLGVAGSQEFEFFLNELTAPLTKGILMNPPAGSPTLTSPVASLFFATAGVTTGNGDFIFYIAATVQNNQGWDLSTIDNTMTINWSGAPPNSVSTVGIYSQFIRGAFPDITTFIWRHVFANPYGAGDVYGIDGRTLTWQFVPQAPDFPFVDDAGIVKYVIDQDIWVGAAPPYNTATVDGLEIIPGGYIPQ